jgi:hypothetical protein
METTIYEVLNPSFNDMTLDQQIEHGINDWAIETKAGRVYFAQTSNGCSPVGPACFNRPVGI